MKIIMSTTPINMIDATKLQLTYLFDLLLRKIPSNLSKMNLLPFSLLVLSSPLALGLDCYTCSSEASGEDCITNPENIRVKKS